MLRCQELGIEYNNSQDAEGVFIIGIFGVDSLILKHIINSMYGQEKRIARFV